MDLEDDFLHDLEGDAFFKKIDEELDYAFALSIQTQYDDELKLNATENLEKHHVDSSSKALSIIDEQWELIDPHPDIHTLFQEYDSKFFYGKLKSVEVKWSPRMTACAGVCSYEGRGGLCSVRLSVPLLKLRPRRDLVETLLHEMIHAYLFVTHNNKDRDGHGPEFLSHMNRINKETGTKITVYHSFHDEVEVYQQHWWKCDGPCQNRRPYYGVLKRAMNRAPGPSDNWWTFHQTSCGGKFIKIKEPENYSKKKPTKRKIPIDSESSGSSSDIRSFLKSDIPTSSGNDKYDSKPSTPRISNISDLKCLPSGKDNMVNSINLIQPQKKPFIPFQGSGHKLGGSTQCPNSVSSDQKMKEHNKYSLISDTSSKISNGNLLSPVPKLTWISKLNNSRNLFKDQHPSTSSITTKNVERKLIQNPIENFLSSKTIADSENSQKNSLLNEENCNTSRVLCPVCFVLVKEHEINFHLDKCLSNQ